MCGLQGAQLASMLLEGVSCVALQVGDALLDSRMLLQHTLQLLRDSPMILTMLLALSGELVMCRLDGVQLLRVFLDRVSNDLFQVRDSLLLGRMAASECCQLLRDAAVGLAKFRDSSTVTSQLVDLPMQGHDFVAVLFSAVSDGLLYIGQALGDRSVRLQPSGQLSHVGFHLAELLPMLLGRVPNGSFQDLQALLNGDVGLLQSAVL
mmetsp:Transcript_29127/g.63238  ORF Transcript_29127/g.63238 Transcript_29127/m.63238 type:complete len:207 (-) Transcript_29127:1370-1990(-)